MTILSIAQQHLLSPDFGVLVAALPECSDVELVGRDRVLSLLREHGAVLMRGFSVDLERFLRFTDQVAGGLKRDVVQSNCELHYHGERTYMDYPLHVLWLYCQTPADAGGQTKLCDGVRVAAELSARARTFFDREPLCYEFRLTGRGWKALTNITSVSEAAKVLETRGLRCLIKSEDSMLAWYRAPAIRKTRWGGQDAFINTLLHALDPTFAGQRAYQLVTVVPDDILSEVREITERQTLLVEWQTNDVLALDNSRIMHGRRSFSGSRKIVAVSGMLPQDPAPTLR